MMMVTKKTNPINHEVNHNTHLVPLELKHGALIVKILVIL